MQFLYNHIKDPSLYDMEKALSLSQWSEKGRGRFYTSDVDTSLCVESGRAGVTMKNSLVRQQPADHGISAARPFGQRMVAGY